MYRYAVAGAGLQGTAIAYDLGLHGNAKKILLIDADEDRALSSAKRVNDLIGKNIVSGVRLDVRETGMFIKLLQNQNIQTLICAMQYELNNLMTWVATKTKINMCDLGGSTEIVRVQHAYNKLARTNDITIVPDCGMGPGLNLSLAMYAMDAIDQPEELYIWDGGLPQNPEKPWNYNMTFNIRGLTNEYAGDAYFLRNGDIVNIPALSELETLSFPEAFGTLEAAVTSGGLSTAPWTLKGKLKRLENKTLRHPGHWAQMQTLRNLGMFRERPEKVGKINIAPRDLLHALLEPQIKKSNVHDICVIRTLCLGKNQSNQKTTSKVELIDRYDNKTGFTAMQKLTGWHASIVAILCTKGRLPRGVVAVETIPGSLIVCEMRKRGFKISETIELTK
ncbi:MAG: hypothetical protein HYT62_02015 [Candidatus Yanofskybacteria bacterium]|nr:hypothetical protein [Candidatus Yanofskybacteria bacterium]